MSQLWQLLEPPRRGKRRVTLSIGSSLSSRHLLSPISRHAASTRAERETPCLGRSYCLLFAHKVGLNILPWPAILFWPGKESSSFIGLEKRLGSETYRWTHGKSSADTWLVSDSPCTKGQTAGHPRLSDDPLVGVLNLPPSGTIYHNKTAGVTFANPCWFLSCPEAEKRYLQIKPYYSSMLVSIV